MSHRALPFLAALLALLAPFPAAAQVQIMPTKAKTLNIDVTNGDLRAVIGMLIQNFGLKAQVQGGDTSFAPVSLHRIAESLPKVLQAVADSAQAKLIRNSDGSYLLEPKPDAVIPMTTPAPNSTRPQLEIKASFALVDAADLDALLVKPNMIPLPQPSGAKIRYAEYAAGDAVTPLFQMLSRAHRIVPLPLLTGRNTIQTTSPFNLQIPYFTDANSPAHFMTLQGDLTLTPRINRDGSITLVVTPKVGGSLGEASSVMTSAFTFPRTLRNGEPLVFAGWQLQTHAVPNEDNALLDGMLSPSGQTQTNKLQALVIFITPTIISENPSLDARA